MARSKGASDWIGKEVVACFGTVFLVPYSYPPWSLPYTWIGMKDHIGEIRSLFKHPDQRSKTKDRGSKNQGLSRIFTNTIYSKRARAVAAIDDMSRSKGVALSTVNIAVVLCNIIS